MGQHCPHLVALQWVLEGIGCFFFFVAVSFFPFLTSPPKYSASVSAPGGLDLLLEELGPFLYPLGGEREWGC